MSKKKTAVTVKIAKGNHPTQPFTFTINTAGPDLTKKERYTDAYSAKRAALGVLDARTISGYSGRAHRYSGGYAWFTPKGNPIEFVFVDATKRKK